MFTYIRNNIKGYYATFEEEIDPQYWEGKIGTTYEDFLMGKWVMLSERQVGFREEHPDATVEEVWDMSMRPRPVDPDKNPTIERARELKKQEIDAYDDSDEVNTFFVNGRSAWFTAAERSNYRSSINAAETVGLESLTLYVGGMHVSVSTANAKLMLAQIQLYADQCFLVTQQHKDNVDYLVSFKDVEEYDYTVGYPPKPEFTVEVINTADEEDGTEDGTE